MAIVGSIVGATIGAQLGVNTDPQQPNAGSADEIIESLPFFGTLALSEDLTAATSWQPSPQGIAVSPDGAKLALLGISPKEARTNTFGTANDITTITATGTGYAVPFTNPYGAWWAEDGFSLYYIASISTFSRICKIACATAYDVNSATGATALRTDPLSASLPSAGATNGDGTKAYSLSGLLVLHQYSMSTAHDPTTLGTDSKNIAIGAIGTGRTVHWSEEGERLYVVGSTGYEEWTLTVAYDVSSATSLGVTDLSTLVGSAITSAFIRENRNEMYLTNAADEIRKVTWTG
tara:strand:- start:985 stop:1860 length:876 start_codon:yes stop_codon:yes gene_type:complete